jgi:hypothetical protein
MISMEDEIKTIRENKDIPSRFKEKFIKFLEERSTLFSGE